MTAPPTFNATEIRHLRAALESAIHLDSSLVDAYHINYDKRSPRLPKTVPAEYRPMIARCLRRITAYRKLLAKIKGGS